MKKIMVVVAILAMIMVGMFVARTVITDNSNVKVVTNTLTNVETGSTSESRHYYIDGKEVDALEYAKYAVNLTK